MELRAAISKQFFQVSFIELILLTHSICHSLCFLLHYSKLLWIRVYIIGESSWVGRPACSFLEGLHGDEPPWAGRIGVKELISDICGPVRRLLLLPYRIHLENLDL